jgi:predicted phage baseplate assembly protein
MVLPAPRLDDRAFQDLVDDAKRLVQQRCPQWTDHNVSDPGVTLIELFAWMTDLTLYRLNRVPDRLYLKFLDLIGVGLFPATAARTDVTFRLSAPQPEIVPVPAGTQVASRRRENEEPVVFTVTEPLDIIPCEAAALATAGLDGRPVDHSATLTGDEPFYCFSGPPQPGESMLVGLSNAVPSCLVALRFDAKIEGRGVDPRWPPLTWEAWTPSGWAACELESDETGGLNRAGDVLLHVPKRHTTAVMAGRSGGWLRCRVTDAAPQQPTYSASPRIHRLTACTVGGTTASVHAEVIENEVVGVSAGVPGESFPLARLPVVRGDAAPVLEVSGPDGWRSWRPVTEFAGCGPDDEVFRLDEAAGVVELGPAVRERDGALRRFGGVPPKGAQLRLRSYRTGGGVRGNIAVHALDVLKSAVPYITSVTNRRPATGGVEGETVEEAKRRGPLSLQTRDRAVTAGDYELLARRAAPEAGRVACVPAGDGAGDTGVRLLVVPDVPESDPGNGSGNGSASLSFEELVPAETTLAAIARHIDERRMIGARVAVEPPDYQGFTVVAKIRASRAADPEVVTVDTTTALHRYFHPLRGGPDGTGWPFGRPVLVGEAYAVLQRVAGVELVEEVRLFPADAVTGARGDAVQRIDVSPQSLVFSYQHVVRVSG